MPHARQRHAIPALKTKLKFSPIVAIQGARQVGKSFLVRELLNQDIPELTYITFDHQATRGFARTNPESFLSQYEKAAPLVIDEAQKVPEIFDALKYEVDRDRVPGRFLILGSTEFSKLTMIRESLTGRMSRLRIYPMNIAEALELPPNPASGFPALNRVPRVKRAQLMNHLSRGGMPGIFSTRSETERSAQLQDWLDLTTQRDALLFPKLKIEPELCRAILEKVATLDLPEAGAIARVLKRDLRRIKTHLQALRELFVIHALDPHPSGTGKPLYFLCDVSMARRLGADFERQLYTWTLQEQLSQRSYRADRDSRLFYYRTPKGRIIHLILESSEQICAMKLLPEERVTERDLEILKAFRVRHEGTKKRTTVLGIGPSSMTFGARSEKIEIFPWESVG